MERLKRHVCHSKGRWNKAEEKDREEDVDEMTLCLYECLRAVGLQHHYASFTSMGVHRAAHLSALTMEDYPILGIHSMEDRTRLFHLVQLVKNLDLESLDEHHTEANGSCYYGYGEPHEDVYDDEDEMGAAVSEVDTAPFSKPLSIRRRLDFSSEMTDHHQKQFSGPVDTVLVNASYDRKPVQGQVRHKLETGNMVVYGCRGNKHRPNVHSCPSDNHHAGGITKPDVTRGDSTFNSCTNSSPKRDSLQKPTAKSATMASRRLTNKQSGHKENVRPQSKGISSKTKLQTVIGSNESSKWFARPTPVYESKRTSGYNYGLPQSSLPTPNKRPEGDQRISVCVRKRPLTHAEKRRREADVVTTPGGECVIVLESKEAVNLTQYILQHRFYFDQVFGEEYSNDEVYRRTAYPLVQHMLSGGKATCFAYGQTGAGKTHTMLGSSPGRPGLYALAARDIFAYLSTTHSHSHYAVYVSFFEIYCGQLYDLLDHRKRLFAREDGQKMVHIAGLCHVRVDSVNSLLEVISQGTEERTQGMSGVNPLSSRSHALLQIQLRDRKQQTFGRMWFVDLAGSERASDSREPDKQSRMEGAEINQSLLALKECIRSLDQEQSHTPFRQSKLTQVLKDSFVGDSMTCMIANISPGDSATEHTLNTLRYADRVKELRGLGGHRRGRRSKTTPSPKRNLSNSNSSLGGSSVGTRGKSPPKKPKLGRQREAFGPTTPTTRVPNGGKFLCSTPKNNRWGEETSVQDRNGIVFEQITPVRGSLGMGDKRQMRGVEHKKDFRRENTERYKKDDSRSFSNQKTEAGLVLRQPKDEQPCLWEVQRDRAAREGNLCLARRGSGFCNREVEKQQGVSSKQGKEEEMRCRQQRGQVERNKDACDEVERMREGLQVKEKNKEKERHLRLYHQQLQQFVPSSASSCYSNQTSLASSVSASSFSSLRHSSNLSVSPLTYDHLQEVLDVYRARVVVGAHCNRGQLPFPSEQVCLQTETFPSYNVNNDEESHGDSAGVAAEWRASREETEATFRQDRGGSERGRPLEATQEGEVRVRRPVQMEEGERRWAWVSTTDLEQAERMTGAMLNDVEALVSNNYNCDSEEIREVSQEEVDALTDEVWITEEGEEADGLGHAHSNIDGISIFNQPPAESASQRAPAERPLSPVCEHNNRLLTLSSLNCSPESKQSRCNSKILPLLNTLQGVPSSSHGEKELRFAVNASKRDLASLPLTTSIKQNGCIEPFKKLPENMSYSQVRDRQESKAKMSVLPQEETFADFLNDSMDPLSISMLQVDRQAATTSFLQGEQSINSLGPGGEGYRRGMEKEHFTCMETAGKVEEDKEFHMSLLEKICRSSTSDTTTHTNPTEHCGLGMMKSSLPMAMQIYPQNKAQSSTEILGITASAPPLQPTPHASLQTSAIQSISPSAHYSSSHNLITHSATQVPPQYVHNKSASSTPASQSDNTLANLNTVPNQRHSVHSGQPRNSNTSLQLTGPRASNNQVEDTLNQKITPTTNQSTLEDLDHAQWCVVQAHWEQLKEMEALTYKEGTLLCQQPDMAFGEYVYQLEEIMERKAKCVHSLLAQLQPYLKSSPSSYHQHKQEDNHDLIT